MGHEIGEHPLLVFDLKKKDRLEDIISLTLFLYHGLQLYAAALFKVKSDS